MTRIFLIDGVGTPPSPGEMIRRKLLEDMHLTQSALARAIGISKPRLNMLLSGRCPLSPEIALRIERVFGISPQFWLRARADYELFQARRRLIAELEGLPQLKAQDELRSSSWSRGDWQVAC